MSRNWKKQEKDISTPRKPEQGDFKKHLPGSIERKLEAMMTMKKPTGKADTQPREARDTSKKRSRIQLTEKSHRAEKKTCIREDTSEDRKTCPPGQQTEKINGITEEEQGQRRRHTVWEDI